MFEVELSLKSEDRKVPSDSISKPDRRRGGKKGPNSLAASRGSTTTNLKEEVKKAQKKEEKKRSLALGPQTVSGIQVRSKAILQPI